MKRMLSLLAAGMFAFSCAAAETPLPQTEIVAAIVNGEDLLYSDYETYEANYLNTYRDHGVDVTDPAVKSRIQDAALSAAIENLLMQQDMRAQGCYDFAPEIEAWLQAQGEAAWENALVQVGEYLRYQMQLGADDDVSGYAQQYADELGVSAKDYVDRYREQYAYSVYCQWLTTDCPVTEEDVLAEYERRVTESKALYENDVPAFETAAQNDVELWYKPAGYRGILQILLPANGETDEEKLASVKEVTDLIETSLQNGEDFVGLALAYGTDSSMQSESFLQLGYQVHADSIMWEDAFKEAALALEKPGDYSQPVVSELGVHILYYLNDASSGPVEMTEDVFEALQYSVYTDRVSQKMEARVQELADQAVVKVNEF